MSTSERYGKGAARFQELLGIEPRPGMLQADFQKMTLENLFCDVWTRPGLELRERSMITVAALVVLGREPELRLHLRGALRAGLSRQTIEEMMIHLAHYGGWPVGVAGMRAAKEVFEAVDAEAGRREV